MAPGVRIRVHLILEGQKNSVWARRVSVFLEIPDSYDLAAASHLFGRLAFSLQLGSYYDECVHF